MSPSAKVIWLPAWLRDWIQYWLVPALGIEPRQLLLGVSRGMLDAVLLILLGLGFLSGGHWYMDDQYTLPTATQATTLKWAPIADHIARRTDIPREVPLVLWFKENSMKAENPELCTGIIGAYDLVRSGEHACFTPGPISDIEVSEQLAIAAVEFKKRCPDISYYEQDPDTLKRCYFAYNAGSAAAARLDPEQSAYVMSNYDQRYANMVYTDVELGTVQVTTLGAWPAHLAIQSLIVSQWDSADRPFTVSLLDISTRIYDAASFAIDRIRHQIGFAESEMSFPEERELDEQTCLTRPHLLGQPALRPRMNPVGESPLLTQDVHGCSYSLPGADISSQNSTAVLQAPMPGRLTTYTDRWYNSTIRIENDEWIVWLLHPRSYLVEEGEVKRGQPVGVIGAVGNATGPHVHYAIFDRVNDTFVDPSLFIP
jgi:hypothetical protein